MKKYFRNKLADLVGDMMQEYIFRPGWVETLSVPLILLLS